MKMNFKHVAATALAVAMSLSLASPALAAETNLTNGSLTVSGPELKGKTVTAVRMFTSHVTQKTTEGEPSENTLIYDSYELEDAWLSFFTTEPTVGNGNSTIGLTALKGLEGYDELDANDTDDVKEAAVDYVAGLMPEGKNDETKVVEFAAKARAWAFDNSETLGDLTVTDTATGTDDSNVGSVTFGSLTSGYYLVYLEGGSYSNGLIPGAEASTGIIPTRGTDAMMINVPNAKTEWKIKSEYPTVDKTVDTDGEGENGPADEGSAQIGQEVEFTLTSHTPNMDDYTEYYFQFVDTLTGLTYKENSVSVTVGGQEFTGFEVTAPSEDNNTLTIALKDLKKFVENKNLAAGAEIVVKYKATVNEDAIVEDKANNKVEVQYGNDSENLATSTPDEVDVYNYNINVHKYAEGDENNWLANATFVLSKNETLNGTGPTDYDNAIAISVVNDQTNTYKIDPDSATYEFTTVASGNITIKGLEAGTYYLHEVTAPTGYNKLKKPVKIEIVVAPVQGNESTTGASFENPVYIVTIDGVTTTGAVGDSTIKVENKQGITLPETGGIGTIGLTIAGVAIVLIGVFAPARRRTTRSNP